eukprot:gb/GECG01002080.1/.p1 GENE.gb/GECG01002080.1/~~gb/GECG01002080.1/.p1  ORF type:complete len:224 (+),score=34.17 gb/GECG01002080.1/:1-672(+)
MANTESTSSQGRGRSQTRSKDNTSVLRRIHSLNPKADSRLPRNSKGGILVEPSELEKAFKFFDTNDKGHITLKDLKKRLKPFYKDMPHAEFEFLMGGRKSLTLEDLHDLLDDNEITGFDPVEEAFKVYDPDGTGYADIEVVKNIFFKLGFEDLGDDDIETLIETADTDGDGKISLQDFRNMLGADVYSKHAEESEHSESDSEVESVYSDAGEFDAGAADQRRT